MLGEEGKGGEGRGGERKFSRSTHVHVHVLHNYLYLFLHVHVYTCTCTVPVIKKLKYRTEAVPKQYRINTERRANLDSNVYMYAGAVRCGTVRYAVRAVRCARAVRAV